MNLETYFETNKGAGILSTAGKDGQVNSAIYAVPHVLTEDTITFIMRDRLSHTNVVENPHACFMYIEEGPGYKGKRLYLTKIDEEKNTDRLIALRKRSEMLPDKEDLYLVTFKVTQERPLTSKESKE